ncbi:MAG: sortase domain-containing protein [Arachnia sp.]
MTSTGSPLQWRVLIGGITGLVGVGVIGAALAFPAIVTPEALPAQEQVTTPSATSSTTPSRVPTPPPSASVLPSASASPSTPMTPTSVTPAVEELEESAPTKVRIPSLGVDASTVTLGLNGNEMETPDDPDQVGWFTGAHTPGAPGRAVLAGHLTWNGRNTVFAGLPDVAVGAVVEVDREDGTTARFEITRVSTFKKDQFPTNDVYASTEEPSLVLITCGGEYSSSEHYYDSNVIAFATALE